MLFLRIPDVAREAGVSVHTVRRWIWTGRLTSYRPGRHRLIRRADLEAFLTRNARGA
jgi:excisionase family DNA binding protein